MSCSLATYHGSVQIGLLYPAGADVILVDLEERGARHVLIDAGSDAHRRTLRLVGGKALVPGVAQ